MRRPALTLSQLTLALGLSHAIAAQGPPLKRGDRIRLTVPTVGARPFVGVVETVRADTILVRRSAEVLSVFPLDRVTRLEASRGVRRPMWSKTAPLWMPLAGAAIGFIGGYADPASRTSRDDSGAFIAIFGAPLGLLAGVVTAIAVGPREEWDAVPTPGGSRPPLAPSPYIAPGTRGLTLGLRAAF
jgi:hypothetical protein